jgi:hypothetical protein
MDGHGTHKHPTVKRWFTGHPGRRCHFTPTGASRLNQVGRFSAEVTNKRARRGPSRSAAGLETAIGGYLGRHDEAAKPFVWTKGADTIPRRVKQACDRATPP